MNWFQVLVLAFVQGLTEFLPISSSGHLVIVQSFMDFTQPPVVLDVMLHVGTLLAVFFYFRQDLLNIFFGLLKKEKESFSIVTLVLIGTLPAVLVGGVFENQINKMFGSLKINGWFFLLTAVLLFSTYLVKKNNKQFNQLNWKDALFIGLFQALSILPAVSRSGSTIAASLWRGASRETAFRFSFYLFIPAILGALFLQIPHLSESPSGDLGQYLIGMILAGFFGYLSLIILESVLKSAKLYLFGFYCLILGVVILLI